MAAKMRGLREKNSMTVCKFHDSEGHSLVLAYPG
jgi:hypothetical protein